VESSLFIRAGQYKSRPRVLAGIFLRSRDTQAERARRKAEESRRRRRTLFEVHIANRNHAVRDSADGTGAPDARERPAESRLHESVGHAEMGQHGAVASVSSTLGSARTNHARADE
jgi:hypothetical protein